VKERSLVLFTLLAQLAVGLFVLTGLFHGLPSTGVPHPGFVLVPPLALLAMLTSFLHLGTPINAWRAISNLRTSWLSREILFMGLFSGLSSLLTLFLWLGWGSEALQRALGWLTVLAGLALVYCMARIYMLRSLPPWHTWLTLASFYASAFLLGGLALAAIDTGLGSRGFAMGLAALLLLSIQALITIHWARHQMRPVRHLALKAAYQRPFPRSTHLAALPALRLGLGVGGVALFLLAIPAYGSVNIGLLLWPAFLITLAGEAIGRCLFYNILE